MLSWQELLMQPEPIPEGVRYPRECKTAKCWDCGKFTSMLHPVFIGPYREIDRYVGDCCKEK